MIFGLHTFVGWTAHFALWTAQIGWTARLKYALLYKYKVTCNCSSYGQGAHMPSPLNRTQYGKGYSFTLCLCCIILDLRITIKHILLYVNELWNILISLLIFKLLVEALYTVTRPFLEFWDPKQHYCLIEIDNIHSSIEKFFPMQHITMIRRKEPELVSPFYQISPLAKKHTA